MTTTNGSVAAAGQGASSPSLPALPLELQVLELFNRANLVVLGPTDCEKHLGVSKGTISGKLRALAAAGYLQEVGKGTYQAGPQMFSLSMNYLGQVMRQLDQVQQVMSINVGSVRSIMSQLMASFPVASQTEGQA